MRQVMKVTSAEFIKNYGQLADKALSEPVTITRNGHDRLVLLSVDEYARLKRRDRHVYRIGDLPEELVQAIRAAEPPAEAAAFDHEYQPKAGA
jgi:PHD/YefM family antitoxin component YafN of YafNO toxin-antitoxin module